MLFDLQLNPRNPLSHHIFVRDTCLQTFRLPSAILVRGILKPRRRLAGAHWYGADS